MQSHSQQTKTLTCLLVKTIPIVQIGRSQKCSVKKWPLHKKNLVLHNKCGFVQHSHETRMKMFGATFDPKAKSCTLLI